MPMNTSIRRLLRRAVTLVATVACTAAAAFATKPVTIVVPFSAGSITDVVAREFARALSDVMKQPVLVDNRAGAKGVIAGQALLNAAADGHLLLFISSFLTVIDPLMKKQMPYNPVKDFAPVCAVSSVDSALNMTASTPYRTLVQVMEAAKAQPGKLTYAYVSSSTRLAAELFALAAGVELIGVPYRSSVAALTDVAGGQVDMIFIEPTAAESYRSAGKIKALVVAGSNRVKTLPDVPSASEVGISAYDIAPFNATCRHFRCAAMTWRGSPKARPRRCERSSSTPASSGSEGSEDDVGPFSGSIRPGRISESLELRGNALGLRRARVLLYRRCAVLRRATRAFDRQISHQGLLPFLCGGNRILQHEAARSTGG